MPTVHCSHCGSRLNVPATLLGKRGKCPKCQQEFEIQLPPSLETPEDGLVPLEEPAPLQAATAFSKAAAAAGARSR